MRRLFKREEGFTLAWLAMILFLLLAMAGFGTDLGWIYLNSVRTQNAADAAALAGVVNLPGFDPAPDAESAARANGYDPGGADTLALTPTAENELHAELSTSIEPFFMRVLGFTQFDITRESTARYIKPVPLGSPSNCFVVAEARHRAPGPRTFGLRCRAGTRCSRTGIPTPPSAISTVHATTPTPTIGGPALIAGTTTE
jgi:hypothetical protein